MADLIAIGYRDETTALAAMDEVGRLEQDLVIQPDAVAAIVRNNEGKLRVTTNHHAVGGGATWGMFYLRSHHRSAALLDPATIDTPRIQWNAHKAETVRS